MKKKLMTLALALSAACMYSYAGKNVKVDCGDQVKISATPETGYHFVHWSDGSTEAVRTFSPSQDSLLRAYFAINRYEIIFQNYDGTELQKDSLDHGSAVAYTGETPTKPATAQYTYTFAGWSPNISTPATGDAIYVAQFDETVNKYTITFKNWDGSVLESKAWDYGSTPSYSGTPTRPADAENTYTFSGWDKTISVVTGEAEYIAQYNNTKNSYTITLTGDHGKYEGAGTYQYGTDVTIKAITADACYEFVQWNDGNTNATRVITVTGNATYTATFKKIEYTITVESDNETQGKVDAVKL